MSVERSITVELGYEGTDFKRRYKISGVSEAAFNNLKDKILAFNDNVPAEAKTVFVADDGQSEMNGIAAALWSIVEDAAINLEFTPEILNISVDPPTLSVAQGQSAVAIVSASGNEDVTSIIYALSGAPSWLSLADDSINVAPTDNDLGTAVVTVIAADTGSDAQASTEFVAEAKVQPVISSVAVSPATVASYTTATSPETATITAVFNEGVQSLTYELENAPDWVTNDGNIIYVAPRSSAATATVTAIAKDTENSVQASTTFVAMVENPPRLTKLSTGAQGWPGNSTDTVDVCIGGSRTVSISNYYSATLSNCEVETDCDWITANVPVQNWLGVLHLDPPATLSAGDYPVTVKVTASSQYNPKNSVTVEKPMLIQAVEQSIPGSIHFSGGSRTPDIVPTGGTQKLGMQVTLTSGTKKPRRFTRIEIVSGATFSNDNDRNVTVTGSATSVTSVSLQRTFSSVPSTGNFSIVVRFIFDDGTRSSGNFTFNYKRS